MKVTAFRRIAALLLALCTLLSTVILIGCADEQTTPDCRTKCSACGANTLCDGKGCSAHPVQEEV